MIACINFCILPLCILCSAGVLRHPLGLAFDATAGMLYIAEWSASRIAVLDSATDTVLRTIGSGQGSGSGAGQLGDLDGIALDGCGNLLVVDCENNKVVVFNAHSGTQIASFPTSSKPRSVFVDASGNVVVGGEKFICAW